MAEFSNFLVSDSSNKGEFNVVTPLGNGQTLVAWLSAPYQSREFNYIGRIVAADGTPVGENFDISPELLTRTFPTGLDATLLPDGRTLVTWADTFGTEEGQFKILGRFLDEGGQPIGSTFEYGDKINGNTDEPDIFALPDGKVVAAWQSFESTTIGWDIRGRIFDAGTGTTTTPGVAFNAIPADNTVFPEVIALSDGRIVTAYTVFDGFESSTEDETLRVRISNTNDVTFGSEIVISDPFLGENGFKISLTEMEDGNIFIGWNSKVDGGTDSEIFGRILNPDNATLTDQFIISESSANHQYDLAITRLSDGRLLTSYIEQVGSQNADLMGRIFSAEGAPEGEPFVLVDEDLSNIYSPSLSALDDGNAIVSYRSADASQTNREQVYVGLLELGADASPEVNGTNAGENVVGTSASERISAFDGGDWITPGAGSDTVDGGDGRDMLNFGSLADTPGRTNVQYRLDLDLTRGTATTSGDDVYTITNIERVTGSIFADRIKGDAGDNDIRALGDFDWLIASEGSDNYDGGTGRDMVSYLDATAGVTVNLGDSSANTGLAAGDTYVSVERITGSVHIDVFFGDEGENDFRGLGGYDVFYSSTGGRERYDGGNGSDTVTYANATAGVIADLSLGFGSGGDARLDLYTSIENLGGSAFDDVLTGTDERNNLRGLSGDDIIFGGGGIDRISGGRGNDTIDGGDGSDYILYSGDSSDFDITREGTTRNAVVSWTGSGGGDGIDTLSNIEYMVFDDTTIDIWSL